MNWLHFVFLCLALQHQIFDNDFVCCCELITFCIFMPGFTARTQNQLNHFWLWIDYILYFYAWLYSHIEFFILIIYVVNWLHFVFLCLALQLDEFFDTFVFRCELITFCIFMPGFTAKDGDDYVVIGLWIDYILYFYAWLYSLHQAG